ncbi:MAG: tetratricopeptide repeat protein [Gemmataceae bacterium]
MKRLFLSVLAVNLAVGTAPRVEAQTAAPAQPNANQADDQDLNAAAALLREGRTDEAFRKVQEVVKRNPNLKPPRLILAHLAMRVIPQQARGFLEQAAAETPDHPDIYLTNAELSFNESRLSDAILNSMKALELANAPKWNAEQRTVFQKSAHSILAGLYERRKDWNNARAHLAAWLALDPKNGSARERYGAVLFRLGQVDEAQKEFQLAAKDDSTVMPATVLMARQYMNRNDAKSDDMKRAGQFFESAVNAEPNSARVHIAYADYLLQLGNAEAARVHADMAVKLDPKNQEARYFQGVVARMSKDFATAEKIFQELYTASPNNINAANQLALVLVESQDPANRRRGLEIAQANGRQYPQNPNILSTLAYCFYRNGNASEARKILDAILNGVPVPPPDTAYYIALILAEDKQALDETKNVLKAALETPGAFFYRKEAQAMYDRLNASKPMEKGK